jgi:hypothetical protein
MVVPPTMKTAWWRLEETIEATLGGARQSGYGAAEELWCSRALPPPSFSVSVTYRVGPLTGRARL